MSLEGSSGQSSIVERSREVIQRVAQRLTTRPVRVGAASLLWTAAGLYSSGLPRTLANVTSTLISSGILVGAGETIVAGARRVGEKVREFKRKREEQHVQSHNESEKMEMEEEVEDNGAGISFVSPSSSSESIEIRVPDEKRLRTSGEFDANALNEALEQSSEQFPDVEVGKLEVSAPSVVIERELPQQDDDSLELTAHSNKVETPKNRPE